MMASPWQDVTPVPCQHIADYYHRKWEFGMCIAWNLLRRGYGQWSRGVIERDCNNLYGESDD